MTATRALGHLKPVSATDIKSHLRTFVDVPEDGTGGEPQRLTLDKDRTWFAVQCPEGHVHLIPEVVDSEASKRDRSVKPADPSAEVVFECADCDGARYAVEAPAEPAK